MKNIFANRMTDMQAYLRGMQQGEVTDLTFLREGENEMQPPLDETREEDEQTA